MFGFNKIYMDIEILLKRKVNKFGTTTLNCNWIRVILPFWLKLGRFSHIGVENSAAQQNLTFDLVANLFFK